MNERLWNTYRELNCSSPDPFSSKKIDFYGENSGNILECNKNSKPEIAIVVPAFNEQKLLARCLAGINLCLGKSSMINNTNVVVVDNASTDETSNISMAFGALVVRESSKGIAYARQAGLESTQRSVKYVLTTDSDTLVPDGPFNWVDTHVAGLSNENTKFTFGDMIYKSDENIKTNIAAGLLLYNLVASRFHNFKNRFGVLYSGGWSQGFHKQTALDFGGYDVKIADGEDCDFMQKMAKFGDITHVEARVTVSARRVLHKGIFILGLSRFGQNINDVVKGGSQPNYTYDDIR